MMVKALKRLHGVKSKYTGVYYSWARSNRTHYWFIFVYGDGGRNTKSFPYTDEGEREAAKAWDLNLISRHMQPVNILKPKS